MTHKRVDMTAGGLKTSFIALALLFSAFLSAQSVGQVQSLTLVNADSNTDIGSLTPGDTLNLATMPSTNLNVRANTTGSVGSVEFGYNNNSSYQVESQLPYALEGDSNGDYDNWTPGTGQHSISATPYENSNKGGLEGTPYQLNFVVIDQNSSTGGGSTDTTSGSGTSTGGSSSQGECDALEVINFTLMNTGTTGPIRQLIDGDTINLTHTPEFSIRADVCDESAVSSVTFTLDGNMIQSENVMPFAIGGDKSGSFTAWNPGKGSYTLKGTAYSGSHGGGQAGKSLIINFVIADKGSQPAPDCHGDPGGSAFIDDCGVCAGGNTGITPNADKDSCGVCFGDGSSCQPAGGGPCTGNEVTGLSLMDASNAKCTQAAGRW
ncbi:MAG: hypothetical protein U5L96_21625 [Owenweeksia sp.]|nr:hypothetical protein [Owenweeksia sp.]